MSVLKRVGLGITIGWDSSGGNSFTTIASVVNIQSTDAKADKAKTSLLSDTVHTYAKTGIEPGEWKWTIAYDPQWSEYQALVTAFNLMNAPAPNWRVSFPDVLGTGSGATTETAHGHIVGISREYKREDFLMADLTIQFTGETGMRTS